MIYLSYKDGKKNPELYEALRKANNTLKVKYSNTDFPTLQINENGDWIDIKCSEDYSLKAGESIKINLGVAMKLPEGCEAHLVPRSSTFDKYGVIQTNSMGIIDNSYSGNNDIWKMPVYATRDVEIKKGDRLCQFRLEIKMSQLFKGGCIPGGYNSASQLHIIEVLELTDPDRGGFGSSGR